MDGTYAPQSPDLSAYHSYSPDSSTLPTQKQQQYHQKPYVPSSYDQTQHYNGPQQSSPHSFPLQPLQPSTSFPNHQLETSPYQSSEMAESAGARTRNKRARASEFGGGDGDGDGGGGSGGGEGETVGHDIEVKTKFPVARIKRIMQADEDVGKVAQVTPVAVAKALELFMIELVSKSSDEAKTKSSKRVTASHLKAALSKDEQFDFLAEIISKVPDAPAPTTTTTATTTNNTEKVENGDDSAEGRKRRGGSRKKRRDSDSF
ncbi:MAG: hypothetical protein M1837_006183 [Sclerophora amabilis]|nr:MAG: hypothetical protein M1837_006183 [Sclerophora amabilis]